MAYFSHSSNFLNAGISSPHISSYEAAKASPGAFSLYPAYLAQGEHHAPDMRDDLVALQRPDKVAGV